MADKKKNDFDAEILTQTAEQHGKDISDITDRLAEIEKQLKPEGIAGIIESASKDSKKIDLLFSKLFCDMMTKDEDVKKTISSHIKTTDRSAVYSMLKKWGGILTGAVLYVLGVLTNAFISYLIH